jgi:hypothetical protein
VAICGGRNATRPRNAIGRFAELLIASGVAFFPQSLPDDPPCQATISGNAQFGTSRLQQPSLEVKDSLANGESHDDCRQFRRPFIK